jgi:SAM-dependent methyltransferase
MSNDAVYAAGLLNRALDPATQPPEIKEFLGAEYEALCQLVSGKLRVIDIGCGTGRHLLGLQNSLALGLGLDYERGSVAEARRRAFSNVHFVRRMPLRFRSAVRLISPFAPSIPGVRLATKRASCERCGASPPSQERVCSQCIRWPLSDHAENGIVGWAMRLWPRPASTLKVRAAFDPSTSLQSGYGGWWGSAQLLRSPPLPLPSRFDALPNKRMQLTAP